MNLWCGLEAREVNSSMKVRAPEVRLSIDRQRLLLHTNFFAGIFG